MLKIRLQRVGRKHDPSFRVVLTDSKNGPKSGKFLEILGNYDAKKNTKVVDGERVKELIANGAQVSDTVHNILVDQKIIEGKKVNVLPKKSPVIDEEKLKAEAEAKEKAKADVEAKAKEAETKTEESKEETPTEETPTEEAKEEAPVEEVKEDAPAEEVPAEETAEEEKTTA